MKFSVYALDDHLMALITLLFVLICYFNKLAVPCCFCRGVQHPNGNGRMGQQAMSSKTKPWVRYYV